MIIIYEAMDLQKLNIANLTVLSEYVGCSVDLHWKKVLTNNRIKTETPNLKPYILNPLTKTTQSHFVSVLTNHIKHLRDAPVSQDINTLTNQS